MSVPDGVVYLEEVIFLCLRLLHTSICELSTLPADPECTCYLSLLEDSTYSALSILKRTPSRQALVHTDLEDALYAVVQGERLNEGAPASCKNTLMAIRDLLQGAYNYLPAHA